ncbi:MAG: hypothetical protein C4519_19170 [Desulfobacteraceae bacterium]|nr:MAG: hypothetical protein C4519_19170 [Desulfobacteraceae bacterium]
MVVIGSVFISLSVFWFCITLLGGRNPKKPKWASDGWIDFHCPFLLGFALVGISLWIKGLAANGINQLDIVGTVLIFAVTVFGVRAMKIGKRIAEYEEQSAPAVGTCSTTPEGDEQAQQTTH